MTDAFALTEAQALHYSDLKRLQGRRGLLFDLLSDEDWHTNAEAASVGGFSFNDSIYFFRKQGWIIESQHVHRGEWRFRLVGKEAPPVGHKPMSRPQALVAGHYMHAIIKKFGGGAAAQLRDSLPLWMQSDSREWIDPQSTATEPPTSSSSS